jgi:hypothetical protein
MVERRPRMRRSRQNTTVLLFTWLIQRSDRSHVCNWILAVGCLGFLYYKQQWPAPSSGHISSCRLRSSPVRCLFPPQVPVQTLGPSPGAPPAIFVGSPLPSYSTGQFRISSIVVVLFPSSFQTMCSSRSIALCWLCVPILARPLTWKMYIFSIPFQKVFIHKFWWSILGVMIIGVRYQLWLVPEFS